MSCELPIYVQNSPENGRVMRFSDPFQSAWIALHHDVFGALANMPRPWSVGRFEREFPDTASRRRIWIVPDEVVDRSAESRLAIPLRGAISWRPHPRIANAVSLDWLMVQAACRGRGIARALLAAAATDAGQHGAERLCVTTLSTWTEAVRFYRHVGFREP